MKIDHDYLKAVLEAFEAAPAPVTDILELQAAGLNYHDEQFIFHMGILTDQGFVERDDKRPGFGLTRGGDGHIAWSASPLRLTASGHQFIEAISNKTVWASIKQNFKDSSLGTISSVAKKLSEEYIKKKIDDVIRGDF